MEHKHAKVLRAIADGKEVEFKGLTTENWMQLNYINPINSPEFEWRIKPEPKPPIIEEWYLFHGGNGNFFVNDKFLPNVRFTFDPDTKMPIKVELI